MHLRMFCCPTCGHRMRLTGERCGHCYSLKPIGRTAPFVCFICLVVLLVLTVSALSWALLTIGHPA